MAKATTDGVGGKWGNHEPRYSGVLGGVQVAAAQG